jgi:hypothetical protein
MSEQYEVIVYFGDNDWEGSCGIRAFDKVLDSYRSEGLVSGVEGAEQGAGDVAYALNDETTMHRRLRFSHPEYDPVGTGIWVTGKEQAAVHTRSADITEKLESHGVTLVVELKPGQSVPQPTPVLQTH